MEVMIPVKSFAELVRQIRGAVVNRLDLRLNVFYDDSFASPFPSGEVVDFKHFMSFNVGSIFYIFAAFGRPFSTFLYVECYFYEII